MSDEFLPRDIDTLESRIASETRDLNNWQPVAYVCAFGAGMVLLAVFENEGQFWVVFGALLVLAVVGGHSWEERRRRYLIIRLQHALHNARKEEAERRARLNAKWGGGSADASSGDAPAQKPASDKPVHWALKR